MGARVLRDNLDERRLGEILGGLLPPPVASVVDGLPLVGNILSGGTNSLPPLPAPVQSPTSPSPTGSSSSSSNGGGSPPSGGGSPPSTSGSSPSTGGGSPPSNGDGSSPSTGGGSPPSTGGGSPPSTGGGSSPSTGGGFPPSTGGGSPPSSGGAPSTGSGSPPSTSGGSTAGGSSPPSDGSFPSMGGSSSHFNGGGSPSPGSSGSSSGSGGGDPSSSSTTTTGAPESPGISQPSPSTVSGGSILTDDRAISSTNSTSGSNQNSTFTSSVAPPVANVASNSLPNTILSGVVVSSSPPSFTNYPSSTNGPNGTGTNNNPGLSPLANPHHQLSSGKIVAIIIAVFVLFVALPITIFVLRRRSTKQRDERKTKWWFAITRPSHPYEELDNGELIPPGTQTARSSFLTTFDRSDSGGPTLIIPPAMAETGRGNASRPALVINTFDKNHNSNLEENRCSIGSAGSDRSQYLIVPQRDSTNPDPLANTPMSVRPFSPSESFAFPKPPEPVPAGPTSVASGLSRPTSNATSVTSAASGPLSLPMFTPLVIPHIIKSPSPITIPTTDQFTDNNPFDDPTTPVIDTSAHLDVQVVRCSFIPTLPDELNVRLDDHVRVLHRFDDGWGLVEKVTSDGSGNESGLIPMDCLKKPEEDIGPGHGDGVGGCEEPHVL